MSITQDLPETAQLAEYKQRVDTLPPTERLTRWRELQAQQSS